MGKTSDRLDEMARILGRIEDRLAALESQSVTVNIGAGEVSREDAERMAALVSAARAIDTDRAMPAVGAAVALPELGTVIRRRDDRALMPLGYGSVVVDATGRALTRDMGGWVNAKGDRVRPDYPVRVSRAVPWDGQGGL